MFAFFNMRLHNLIDPLISITNLPSLDNATIGV